MLTLPTSRESFYLILPPAPHISIDLTQYPVERDGLPADHGHRWRRASYRGVERRRTARQAILHFWAMGVEYR
jgi:hypothetical protein